MVTGKKSGRRIDHIDNEIISIPMRLAQVNGGAKRLLAKEGSSVGNPPDIQYASDLELLSQAGDTCGQLDSCGLNKEVFSSKPVKQFFPALSGLKIREEDRFVSAHVFRIAIHYLQIRPHMRRQTDFIDQQEIAVLDCRTAFARNFVSLSDVDHVNKRVDELRVRTWPKGCRRHFQ